MGGRRPVGDIQSSTSHGSPPPNPAGGTQQSTSLGDPPLQPAKRRKQCFPSNSQMYACVMSEVVEVTLL